MQPRTALAAADPRQCVLEAGAAVDKSDVTAFERQVDVDAILEQARKDQAAILAEAAKSRDKIVEAAKDKAGEEAAKIIESAREQINMEKEDAIRQIRREVALLSVDIAEKVLRVNLDEKKEQMSMIDRLLDEINIPKS